MDVTTTQYGTWAAGQNLPALWWVALLPNVRVYAPRLPTRLCTTRFSFGLQALLRANSVNLWT